MIATDYQYIHASLFIVFILAVFVGAIFLQIFLSKRETILLGLILPAITLLFSLMGVWGIAVFVQIDPVTVTEFIDGELVTTYISEGGGIQRIPGAIGGAIAVLLLMNVPTAVLLLILLAVRSKGRQQRNLEKMAVLDL